MIINIGLKLLSAPSPTFAHDLKVKVTDLKLSYLSFALKFIKLITYKPYDGSFSYWFDNRYQSEIFNSTIPTLQSSRKRRIRRIFTPIFAFVRVKFPSEDSHLRAIATGRPN